MAQMHRTQREELARAIVQQDMAELKREAIAGRIKQARLEAGLSQPEMADALGVISRTYQNYESQKEPRTPWGLMNQIATVTGKTTEWLIHGDKTPDLLGIVAREDQVDDVRGEFLGHVAELKGELAAIRAELSAQREDRAAAAEEIMDLLKMQSGLLERFAAHVERNEEIMQPDALAELVKDTAARTAPAPPKRRASS